ncbi:TIGR01459 family HAD-type hydrolase [Rhodovulum sp. DZ06]|uniref:TIGR01459 family HAD-type hydrolase n=1 Tax=Rhodovulum sp. DZ06 TaxID=3425126 RepID=UPI003D32556E
MSLPPIIESLDEIADRYDALLCDLWGCLHDGVKVHPAAAAALQRFRAKGGKVALFTNAPRPAASVEAQLKGLGAPEGISDIVVSSGDAALESVHKGEWGKKIHAICAADKDAAFFDAAGLEIVPLDQADSVVCTGLRDDLNEHPDAYRDELREAQLRGLPFLNANPDIVVDKGDVRLWCAGALAQIYEEMGGEVRTFGKPHAPIYDYARRRLDALVDGGIDADRILCIGDGPHTDLKGAVAEGLDCLFVTGGLGLKEVGGDPDRPDPAKLERWLGELQLSPRWAIGRLR